MSAPTARNRRRSTSSRSPAYTCPGPTAAPFTGRRPVRWRRAASSRRRARHHERAGRGRRAAGPGRPVHAGRRRGRPRTGRRAGGRAGRAGAAAGPDAGRRAAGGGRAGPGPPPHGTPTGVTTEETDMEYGQGIELSLPYSEAVQAVKAALKEQGFGVLTEFDVKAIMREKIDRDIEDYVILGRLQPSPGLAGPRRRPADRAAAAVARRRPRRRQRPDRRRGARPACHGRRPPSGTS